MNKGKAKQKEETKKGQSAAAQVSNDPISVRRSQKARKRKEKRKEKGKRKKKGKGRGRKFCNKRHGEQKASQTALYQKRNQIMFQIKEREKEMEYINQKQRRRNKEKG